MFGCGQLPLFESVKIWYDTGVMFPAAPGPFGDSNRFDGQFGGDNAGGPPPADAIFESFFENADEQSVFEADAPATRRDDRHFISIGLHFFEQMNGIE